MVRVSLDQQAKNKEAQSRPGTPPPEHLMAKQVHTQAPPANSSQFWVSYNSVF